MSKEQDEQWTHEEADKVIGQLLDRETKLKRELAAERVLATEREKLLSGRQARLDAAVDALDRVNRACVEELELPYYKATNPPAVVGTFVALKHITDDALAKIKEVK